MVERQSPAKGRGLSSKSEWRVLLRRHASEKDIQVNGRVAEGLSRAGPGKRCLGRERDDTVIVSYERPEARGVSARHSRKPRIESAASNALGYESRPIEAARAVAVGDVNERVVA